MAVTNGYADVEHVQPYVTPYALTIGSTSKPTTTQVEGFLDQAAGEIDGILKARGYGTVPATATADVLFLRMYTSFKATVMTYAAGFGSDNFPDGIQYMADAYAQFLKDLKDGMIDLPSQTARTRVGSLKPMRYIED